MKEVFHPQLVQEDPAEFRARAVERAQGQLYDEMMHERNQEPYIEQNPELWETPASEDWEDYLATRPYKDEIYGTSYGPVRHPETGQAIDPEKYFDEKRREHEDPSRFIIHADNHDSDAEEESLVREKIYPDTAQEWTARMLELGVPTELIDKIPATFFYTEGDPEKTDKLPDELVTWIKTNLDVSSSSKEQAQEDDEENYSDDGVTRLIFSDPLNGSRNHELPQRGRAANGDRISSRDDSTPQAEKNQDSRTRKPAVTPKPKTWRDRIKKFMTQEGAITWDKKGNAIVNTDLQERTRGEKIGLYSLGLGSLAIVGAGIGHFIATKDIGFLSSALDVASASANSAQEHGTTSEHLQEAQSVVEAKRVIVEQGHGFTQEIQDLFPGHDPQDYLRAHEATVEKFGPAYIQEASFRLPDGTYGIKPGEAKVSLDVIEFWRSQLSK